MIVQLLLKVYHKIKLLNISYTIFLSIEGREGVMFLMIKNN